MRITFNPIMCKEWTLTDDMIIIGSKKIPLSSITQAQHTPLKNGKSSFIQQNGTIQVFSSDCGALGFATLAYSGKQNDDGVRAAEYILTFVGGEETKKAFEKQRDIQKNGFRKRCNVCGQLICYTLDDLENNRKLAKSSIIAGVGGIAGALSGNYAAGATNNQTAGDQLNRIVDYSKCPSCGSRDLSDLSDEDIELIQHQRNTSNVISSADEIKKYKELLDSGIITQEEFENKKKQLLDI